MGLSENEMFDGSLDFIEARLGGWLMKLNHDDLQDWKRARLISFTIAKSMGATKAKSEQDFLSLGEAPKKSQLTDEQIKQLREL